MNLALDKTSPVPLYYQLAEAIKEQIHAGMLLPNAQVPPERELSEQTRISRMTARQAIAFLVRDGTLVVKPGVGTFVAEPKVTYQALHLLGFTEESMQRGSLVTSRVLELELVQPPAGVCAGLNLGDGDLATKIVRLRESGETPLLLETTYVPLALCPTLRYEDLAETSLYMVMEQRYGLRIARAHQTLEAVGANDYESGLFGVVQGAALVLLEGVTYLDDGRPAEYFKAVYRGDRIKFELDSYRSLPAQAQSTPQASLRLVQ